MKKEKKIPTILGLLLFLATLYVGNSLINHQTNTVSKASGSCDPVSLQITNITNKSTTISFTTLSDCLTAISIGDKTIENPNGKGKVHYFDINSLEESKVYTFSVISDGKKYSLDSFNFKTGQKPTEELPTSNLAWGKIYKSDHTLATQAIVYFSVTGASPLSALVTSSGEWNITLATSFNESLTNYFSMPANTEESLVVIDDTQNQTQVVGNTNHNNPFPDITIGQNNFSAPSPAVDVELPQTSLLNQDYKFSDESSLAITNPNNNETLSTKRPNFFGTAKPGGKIKIEVHSSTVINDSTTTDDEGDWDWAPPKDLAPGEHTITVTDENENTVSKKFVVLAAESNTSFIASSSATPTQKPTSTPMPTPTSIPTSIPSTSSGIPRTGNTLPTVIILVLSLISISSAFIYSKKLK